MNPEIKTEWIKRLRSGEIPQIKGRLVDGSGRCCLGVACDIAVEQKVITVKDHWYAGTNGLHLLTIPPYAVADWAGEDLNKVLSFRDREDAPLSLAYLNDEGLTFDQIADIIEWTF